MLWATSDGSMALWLQGGYEGPLLVPELLIHWVGAQDPFYHFKPFFLNPRVYPLTTSISYTVLPSQITWSILCRGPVRIRT